MATLISVATRGYQRVYSHEPVCLIDVDFYLYIHNEKLTVNHNEKPTQDNVYEFRRWSHLRDNISHSVAMSPEDRYDLLI